VLQQPQPFFNIPIRKPQLTYIAASNSYQQTDMSSSASTPNSLESFPDLLSPSSMKLPTRKRSYSKHLDGGLAPNNDGPSKSRRASPSPFMNSYGTSPAAPGGESSGYVYLVSGDGYINLSLVVRNITLVLSRCSCQPRESSVWCCAGAKKFLPLVTMISRNLICNA
jgi:hypothetical protein